MRFRPFIFLLLILGSSQSLFAQKLTLTELMSLCNKRNWEDVNQYLISKNWDYFESEKGNDYQYSTIIWSYNREYYGDKAAGWFRLYTYENFPSKISYNVFNTESYQAIQRSIAANGFKLINSEIEDDEVVSHFQNAGFNLDIYLEKRRSDDWSEASTTSYRILLIKKAGVYDSNNGKKKFYHDNGNIKSVYTLVNGEISGQVFSYHENGELALTGYYTNGIQNGLFKEFTEDGELLLEYYMVNDKKNGLFKKYKNGKVWSTINYVNDLQEGLESIYVYDNSTEELIVKMTTNYHNDVKNGMAKIYAIEKGKERLLSFENYVNDILEGAFQKVTNDSLIIGSYLNGELHGDYKIYRDYIKSLFGGFINTDISMLHLTTEGKYNNGLKHGFWKNYDTYGALVEEGRYKNDQEEGEWKFYYNTIKKDDGTSEPFSGQLYKIATFKNGQLNGLLTEFSDVEESKVLCLKQNSEKSYYDSCTTYKWIKSIYSINFTDNKKNGQVSYYDSNNLLIFKGYYLNDKKTGEWTFRKMDFDFAGNYVINMISGSYFNDLKTGKWIRSYTNGNIIETTNYKANELDGENNFFNYKARLIKSTRYEFGSIKEFTFYDTLTNQKQKTYEIFNDFIYSFRCRLKEYGADFITVQEYWINEKTPKSTFQIENLIENISKNPSSGNKDGIYTLSTLDGKILINGNYTRNEKTGYWTIYFYDQNAFVKYHLSSIEFVPEQYFFLNGSNFSGEFVYIDQNKNIKELRKIEDGLRNGKTVYYDLNTSKVIKKEKYKKGELK